MQDTLLVRGRQTVQDLDGDLDGFGHRQWSGAQPVPQRLSFQKLGDEEMDLFLRPHVEHRQDVRMVEHARSSGFLLEARDQCGVRRQLRAQHFDCDIAPQTRVVRPVDRPHPAGTERSDDLVRADLRSFSQRHPHLLRG